LYCGGAFVLFRIADIIKPWPARRLETLPHGWGVLIDDLAAAVYAMLAMQLILRVVVPALG
jgi:phosphatidylglycerophosphatase A